MFVQMLTDIVCTYISFKLGVLCSPTFRPLSKAWAPSVPSRFSRAFSKCLMNIKIFTQVRIKNIYAGIWVKDFHFLSYLFKAGQCNAVTFLNISNIEAGETSCIISYMCLLTEAWFLFLTTSRWFAVRLDGICSVFVTITAFGCLYLRDGTVWFFGWDI